MSSAMADRNLLFGLLALQIDLLNREQLIEGFQAWMLRKQTPVGEVLRERGVLSLEDIAAVEALVGRKLARCGGDVQRSLSGVRVEGFVRQALSRLGDGVQQGLSLCPAGEDESRTSGVVLPPAVPGMRYRRLRPHAKGGLGEVTVALDTELQREVALKEIQGALADHPDARSRFVREAEITGKLEHPGVVPVYGLGVSPDGRPWYAMRFIRGETLSDAIKRHHAGTPDPLSLRQLLGRFVAVCNAVGYAHSRGVIHRDIKPSNVMLGEYGETLLVDWGLARVLEDGEEQTHAAQPVKLTSGNESTPTEMGQALGTPGYMSPEQAAGRLPEVRQRSDVFALGATLYQILTGQPPYVGDDALRQAERGEVVPARQVRRDVPRALEAVCLRAMARRSEDRYGSARDLAAEVERWLADEPVQADREPVWERVGRWSRKHRTLVTSAVAVLLVTVVGLVVGIAVVTTERQKTAEQRDEAIENEKLALRNEHRAVKAEKEAKANLEVAEGNLKLAKKAVNDTFDLAKKHPLLQGAGMQPVRKLLLEKALPFYKKFRVLRGDDTRSQAELASQYFSVGYITNEIGNKQEARKAYSRARNIRERLVKHNPGIMEYQTDLATTLTNIGNLLREEGNRGEAIKTYHQALMIREKLVKANPAVTEYQSGLALTLHNLGIFMHSEGKRREALDAYIRARNIREKLVKDNPTATEYQNDLVGTLNNLGVLLSEENKGAEALKAYTQARNISEKLVKHHPAVARYQNSLALVLHSMGLLLAEMGNRTEAMRAYLEARSIREKLVKRNPAVTEYQHYLASTLNNIAMLLRGEGKRAEALKVYTQAREIGEKLAKDNPTATRYQNDLATTLYNIGKVLHAEGKRSEALQAYSEARDIREKLVKDNPNVTTYQSGLALTFGTIGNLLYAKGKNGEAMRAYRRARSINENLVKSEPTVTDHQRDLAVTLTNMGVLLREEGKPAEALKVYAQARDIHEKLVKDNPGVAEYQSDLASTLNKTGNLLRDDGKSVEALKAYSQARDIRNKLVKDNPKDSRFQTDLADTLLDLSRLRRDMKQPKEALADLDLALQHLQAVLKTGPRSADAADSLFRVYYYRALTLAELDRHAAAAADWDKFLLVAPAKYRVVGRINRALSHARTGQSDDAMKEAVALGCLPKLTPGNVYNLACVASLCASVARSDLSQPLPRREHFADSCVKKAIRWLREAQKAGFFKTKANRDRLLTDPDLAALRNRDDFKQFLKSLDSP